MPLIFLFRWELFSCFKSEAKCEAEGRIFLCRTRGVNYLIEFQLLLKK